MTIENLYRDISRACRCCTVEMIKANLVLFHFPQFLLASLIDHMKHRQGDQLHLLVILCDSETRFAKKILTNLLR